MEVVYKPRARKTIYSIIEFIESKNTEGSGARWFDRLDEKIISLARTKSALSICRHSTLARFGYRCYEYSGWVIAFRITNEKFEVCRFILASRLS